MGPVAVPAQRLWGAQTQRSVNNFSIGDEKMPEPVILALTLLKKACAVANCRCGKLTQTQADAIAAACDEILAGKYPEEFPLHVWQTGSGTQTNMNVNEVIAHIAAASGVRLHPNDHVNCSQSSNDVFPTAMHMAFLQSITGELLPQLERLTDAVAVLQQRCSGIRKIGRTHLQDAVPLSFADEISGWHSMLAENRAGHRRHRCRLRSQRPGGL